MSTKPIIGIPTHLMFIGNSLGGKDICYISEEYCQSVSKAGGIPLLLPPTTSLEDLTGQLKFCNGLLLPGGDDINPLIYGEEPYKDLGEVHLKVDRYEITLTQLALELNVPILGICRGCQLLNIACGGNVYQDLSEYPSAYLKHTQKAKRYEPTHTISISPSSLLTPIFGTTLSVNSFHHQAINHLGKDLVATAYAKDGIIEAIEMPSRHFVMGVQWHPEIMLMDSDAMLPLFELFVLSCFA